MKKLLMRVALTALLVSIPAAPGFADDYIFLSGGIDQLENAVDVPAYFNEFDARADMDSGVVMNGGAGLYLSDTLRFEAELAYRSLETDTVKARNMSVVGIGVNGGDGEIECYSGMLNVWIDFPLLDFITPYIGGGVGMTQVRLNNFSVNTTPVVPNAESTRTTLVDDTDWQSGYQLGAGVGFEISDGIVLDLGARYFKTADPEFSDEGGNTVSIENQHSDYRITLRLLL